MEKVVGGLCDEDWGELCSSQPSILTELSGGATAGLGSSFPITRSAEPNSRGRCVTSLCKSISIRTGKKPLMGLHSRPKAKTTDRKVIRLTHFSLKGFLFTCLSKSAFVTVAYLAVLSSASFIFRFYWKETLIFSAISPTSSQFEFSTGEEFTWKVIGLN